MSQAPAETADSPAISISDQLLDVNQWLPEPLLSFWTLVTDHPWLGALLILVVFYLAGLALRTVLVVLVGKLTGLTSSTVDDRILAALKKPIFNTIFYFGVSLAIAVVQLPLGGETLVKLAVSVIVASWMGAALKVTSIVLDALSTAHRFRIVDSRTVPLFDLTLKLIAIMIGSYLLLMIWGINPVGWLASAGIAGLAVGFAAKDTLANLFSGFFIVADAPYKIGDYINLDSGERGKVCAIGLRSTRLLTRDDVEITIPNGVIASAKIINESGGPEALRIRIVVGVAYGSDVDLVCELLDKIGREHPDLCEDPAPKVRLRGFGASSLDFNLMAWITKPEDRGRIAHELYMTIYKTFGAHGIEIPYAKQDVYIKQWPGHDPENDA